MASRKTNKRGTATVKNDVCGRCRKDMKTDEKVVGCETCRDWLHIACEGMPVEVYNFMMQVEADETNKESQVNANE